jgi:hypothetical protein
MTQRKRGGSPPDVASDQVESAEHSARDDIQRLLVEQWKRQIIKEKLFAAKHRRLLNKESPIHPASLDEIKIVSRIGRLRLLWKLGRAK